MNLLFPIFLVAGMFVGLPIFLHFLRKQPLRQIPFPSLRFLGASVLRETKRHRILRWLVLVLRCLAILLLVAGFARPYFGSKKNHQGHGVIVAIDNSFSMQAGTRWADLKQWALERLADLKPGDQVALLLMHPSPHCLLPMTEELTSARNTLAALNPGYESTNYRAPLLLAGEVLKSMPFSQKEIIWLADEQRIGWTGVNFSKPLPPGIALTLPPRVADLVVQCSVAFGPIQRSSRGIAVEVNVSNHGNIDSTRNLTLFVNGMAVANQSLEVKQGAVTRVGFSTPLDGKDTVSIKAVLDPDELSVNDTAYAVLDADTPQVILLSDGPVAETDFLKHALQASPADESRLAVESLPAKEWPSQAVALLRGENPFRSPMNHTLDRFLAQGGNAWIFVDGDPAQVAWLLSHGVSIETRPEPGVLRNWDIAHPILSLFTQSQTLESLLDLHFTRGYAIRGIEPIAEWKDGSTALGVLTIGASRVLIAGFDTSRVDSTLPLKAAFVPLIHESIQWLTKGAPNKHDFHVGEAIPLPGENGTWSTLDSALAKLPQTLGGSFTPTAPGIFEFSSGKTTIRYSVNLAAEESNLTIWPKLVELTTLQSKAIDQTPATSTIAMTGLEAEAQARLWWWLLVLAILFLVSELALANRSIP